MAAKAHVVLAIISACVVVVLLSGAAAMGSTTGTPVVVGLPPPPPMMMMTMAARGGRVEDQEVAEMDSEAHRRVVLALQGALSSSGGYNSVLIADRPACSPHCPAPSGHPYVNNHCNKIYHNAEC